MTAAFDPAHSVPAGMAGDVRSPVAVGPIALAGHGSFQPAKMRPVRLRALLAEAALQNVDLCFLHSRDCESATGMVRAWRWSEAGWRQSYHPLPPVVAILNDPATQEDDEIDQWLRASSTALGTLRRDKLGNADLLIGTPWERHIIPSEWLDPLRPEEQIASWLGGGGVVVKPNDGMRGIGVHFIIPAGSGRWEMIQGDRRRFVTTDEAVARVSASVAARMAYRRYVVQRYIDTRDGSGRPGTLRSEIMRQPGGAWGLVRITGRISPPGKVISTISQGGSLMSVESYLGGRGERDIDGRIRQIEALSVGITERLTASDPAHHFEWAFDLALDQDRQLWFLEANARPLNFGAELERATHLIAYLKSLVPVRSACASALAEGDGAAPFAFAAVSSVRSCLRGT